MVKFVLGIAGTEDMVYMNTASSTMGSIDVGAHFVTFSGNGRLTSVDITYLKLLADQVADTVSVDYQGEIVVGPNWKVVNQCSFIVAPASYINTDSDEDDWQAWEIIKDTWDLVPAGGMKKIRLKFNVRQHGQSSRFEGIVYQVTATGYL